jgi:hypothetical protein
MENDPDHILDEDDAAIGDETGDVDVDDDDLGAEDDGTSGDASIDPTKDIMADQRTAPAGDP